MHVGKCDVLDISFRLLKMICSGFLDDEACLESEDAAERVKKTYSYKTWFMNSVVQGLS